MPSDEPATERLLGPSAYCALNCLWRLPNARTKERRIRSRFPKPFFLAISSAEKRPVSIISRADSTRSRSIAFAGDWPVSSLNTAAGGAMPPIEYAGAFYRVMAGNRIRHWVSLHY
jgi:hypothetical protein